jgi:hypothetical protein
MKVKFEDYAFKEQEKIIGFVYARRDILNLKGIATKADILPSFLEKIIKSERRLTKATFFKLYPVLKELGFEM